MVSTPSNNLPLILILSPLPFRSPRPLSPLPMTRVLYYRLFLVFPDLCPVFPHVCIVLRSLLDLL